MTISQTQLVDILYKKLSGVSKTDTSTAKSPANESNASPQLSPGSTVWQQDYLIPSVTTLPSSNSSVVTVYRQSLSSTVQTSALSESTSQQTWATGLTNWISPQFGAGYQVQLFAGPAGSSTPENFTNLPVGGSGNNDSWYFDYMAGIVNFADTNVPTAAANVSNVVYVKGARYVGTLGISNYGNLTIGNISINGNTITGNTSGISFASNIFVGNIFYANGQPFVSSTYGNTSVAAYLATNTDPTLTYITNSWTANAAYQAGLISTLQATAYSNANAASYLSVYSGNISAGNITTTGNLTVGGNLIVLGNTYELQSEIISNSEIIAQNLTATGNITAGNLIANTGIYAASYFFANGQPFTTYGNTNVATYLPHYGGNIIAANVYATSTLQLPAGSTATRPGDAVAGNFRYNSDSGVLEYYNGTAWIPIISAGGSQIINGDGSNSTYTLDRSDVAATGMLVSINGTVQEPNISYTVSGNQITFAETLLIGDVVVIRYLAGQVDITTNYGDTQVAAYLTANPITNITNGSSSIAIATPGGNAIAQIGGVQTATISQAQINVTGNVVATNNLVGANFLFANGVNILSTVSGGSGTYSNSNVASYLPTSTIITGINSNIAGANVAIQNLSANIGSFYTYANLNYGTSSYSNSNVSSYLTANPISSITNGGSSVSFSGSGGNLIIQIGGVQLTTLSQAQFNVIGNIVASNTVTGSSFLFANGVNILSTVAGTYSNANVAAYLPTDPTITNFQANVGSFYTWANTNFGTSSYSNTNVVAMLSANNTVAIGNVNPYPLQGNITQVFVGNSTTLTSGGTAQLGTTYLMDNTYFGANGATYSRNSQTGGYVFSMGGTNGFAFSGSTGALTANTYQAYGSYAQLNSSGFVTYNSVGITSAGTLTVQGAGGITTTQTSFPLVNSTATTINFGGAATTINMGSTAVGGVGSNVFVGNAIGTSNGNLTVRARGTYNTLTTYVGAGGYNSPPYTNQSLTGGSGTGMTANYGATGGYPNTFVVVNPGTGYKNGDILTLPGGLGCTVILTNYNPGFTNSPIGQADYNFGMDGNLVLPGNMFYPANSAIFGDFSNSTVNYRTIFRPTAANSNPGIYTAPTGTGTAASWQAANSSNLTNASKILIATNGTTDVQLVSGINGTGTYLPLSFLTSGTTQMQLDTGGNLNMVAGGNITTAGNIVAGNYLFSNGVSILSTASAGTYSNTNVAAYIGATSFSSISTALINNVGQINGTAVYLQTNGSHNFYFDSTGNLILPSGGAINYANGQSILTGISGGSSTYSNTNVAAYLTANPIATVGNGSSSLGFATSGGNAVVQIGGVQTATISQAQISVIGNVVATANVTAGNIVTTGATSGNISGANVISANTFQVSSGIFWANGTAWSSSGGGSIYSNANVVANLANYVTNIVSTANITAANVIANLYGTQYGNTVGTTATYTGNVTAANIITTGTYGNITNANVITANTFVGSGSQLTGVATQATGSWTLATGTNTVSFTVPSSGTYSLWVNGSISNGIVTYTATVVVTNQNVPVLGSQYGWYYSAGNNLVLTSMPTQIVGTANVISTASLSTSTAWTFTFGITNNSGSSQTVNWGYTKL